ncbi:MAG: hypothetical protein HQK76_19395 [Desulfobacterales bacterium]|nr:hypothetical protein [Desulfobacterales bacterium]
MLNYIYKSLENFRGVFSRSSTWLIFCLVMLAFMGNGNIIGVSSFCRFWGIGESGYHSILHFFRSSGWSLNLLVIYWGNFVLSQKKTVCINGRTVLIGDHTYVPKDGCKMPGVVSLHQDSETQSKPSYFRGHCWGAVGVLIGSITAPFCIPLSLAIHQVFIHIEEESNCKNGDKLTMGIRLIKMAIDFSVRENKPVVMILDAFSRRSCF